MAQSFVAARATRTHQNRIAAPPEVVFPLCCPVREREWIPGWTAEVVHSASGVAEMDGVFHANRPGRGPSTFVVVRYEPLRRVEYLITEGGDYLERLAVTVDPLPDGASSVTFHRVLTGLTAQGNADVEASMAKVDARMAELLALLSQHCRRVTGRAAV